MSMLAGLRPRFRPTSRQRSQSRPAPLRAWGWIIAPVALAWGAAVDQAEAQTRWVVHPTLSLAWWQVDPHLNHLWATTCPGEPSWRPGDDRASGVSGGGLRTPSVGYSNIADTIPMPRYPRLDATPICPEAISGHVMVADTGSWRGISGEIVVRSKALVSTNEMHDAFAHRAVIETTRYPEIRFVIDSVTQILPGDTLVGTAVGTLHLRGAQRVMQGPVRAWREAGGMRVTGRMRMNAADLTDVWGVSRYALGLGIATGIWRSLYVGVDAVLRPVQQ